MKTGIMTPNTFTGDSMFVSLHWNQAYNLSLDLNYD